MEVAFRAARRPDLAALVAMLADDELGRARETVSDPVAACYEDAFTELGGEEQSQLLVMTPAEDDSAVIGMAQLTIIPGLSRRGLKRGLIESVRVSAAHRGAGLGERLFRHLIDTARERGCGLVQLTTDKQRADAHRFYERLGFVSSHVGMKLVF